MFESNPILVRAADRPALGGVTFDGIIHRTGILVLAAIAGFGIAWSGTGGGLAGIAPDAFMGGAMLASLAALVLALVIIFTRSCNPWLMGAYAVLEGVFLGTVSRVADFRFPGIAFETAVTTFVVFLLVLGLYRARVLRATPAFVKIVTAGMMGVLGLYLVDLVAGLFHHPLGIVNGNGLASIVVSCGIVLLAAVTFVLDFAQAEAAVAQGAAEEYSWQIAFGLLIGLVWLYIEILRLLTKLRSRD